jgi:hypothetical protein
MPTATKAERDKLINAAVRAGRVPDFPEQRVYLRGMLAAAPAETERQLREAGRPSTSAR